MVCKSIDVPLEISVGEQIALEIYEKAGMSIDTSLPQLVFAQSVVIKASYLLFPPQGQDNVLYVDKSNKQIYIYDIDNEDYESILPNTTNMTPMSAEDVKNMINKIKGE
jgi:hypothetical protein